MSVVVKICGVCVPEDARAAAAAGADLLGLNFVPASPRRLDLEQARAVARAVPGTPLVGVFVDAPRDEVARIAEALGLAGLQFHGDESPEYCAGWPQWTIKALRVQSGEDAAARARAYATTYVLLDTHVPGTRGGTGVPLDPALAASVRADRLFVAGGLRADTVADVVRWLRPHGVDVASGVERRPGVKDHAQIEEFIRRAKSA
jgi:phosphoribosylanthranilate isomerase